MSAEPFQTVSDTQRTYPVAFKPMQSDVVPAAANLAAQGPEGLFSLELEELDELIHSTTSPAPPTAVPAEHDPLDIVFEEAHELEFLESSLEAARSALRIALAAIPSRSGLVHVLVPDTRELVVSASVGQGTTKLLGHRVPLHDVLLAEAARSRRSFLLTPASSATLHIPFPERHMSFGWPDCVVVVPVMAGSNMVAAIELLDPEVFAKDAATAAMSYLAQRLVSFLSTHPFVPPPSMPQSWSRAG